MRGQGKDLLKKYFVQQKEVYGIDGYFLTRDTKLQSQKLLVQDYNKSSDVQKIRTTKIKDKQKLMSEIEKEVLNCKRCNLYKHRINTVPGEGNLDTELMFIGEGPGYQEDHQGRPFVGRAGELLTRIIESMGFLRENVYIANIVKCHPMKVPNPELRDNDRPPNEEEISSCLPFLEKQIEIIEPKIICCLGTVSSNVLTKNYIPITQLRGTFFNYYKNEKIKVLATYHPSALLRNPSFKRPTWQDMKLILKQLGRPIPKKNNE